jgi:hypothetical protein
VEHEFHDLTSIFPLASSTALTRLAEDIRNYGQHEPIVLYEEKILDGRNRYNACLLSGVTPRFITFESLLANQANEEPPMLKDPLQWLVRKNISERHLTQAQLAVVALDVLIKQSEPPYKEAELREVAALTGAGWSSVERLAAIQKRNPSIVEQVRAPGTLSVAEASRAAGFIEYDSAPIPGTSGEMFGKGDKFREATEPLIRYLNGWRGRGFEFRHVNYKEATQRVKTIDRLIEGLTEARRDLETRSVKPSLTH